jgi:NAD(P)-dependent dehydrogenase (short-subunit alcohol dehydrogenase family)
MSNSYVVTGAGQGIGRAIAERLLGDADSVVVIEFDPVARAWTDDHPAGSRLTAVAGDAADEAVTERAADLAEASGTLVGWVNNAAVFRDAALHSAAPRDVLDLITLNLAPAVTGCGTAVRRFLARGRGGAIVNREAIAWPRLSTRLAKPSNACRATPGYVGGGQAASGRRRCRGSHWSLT